MLDVVQFHTDSVATDENKRVTRGLSRDVQGVLSLKMSAATATRVMNGVRANATNANVAPVMSTVTNFEHVEEIPGRSVIDAKRQTFWESQPIGAGDAVSFDLDLTGGYTCVGTVVVHFHGAYSGADVSVFVGSVEKELDDCKWNDGENRCCTAAELSDTTVCNITGASEAVGVAGAENAVDRSDLLEFDEPVCGVEAARGGLQAVPRRGRTRCRDRSL